MNKRDELNEMNAEYARLVGEKVYMYASDPSDTGDPQRLRYNFQGDIRTVIGINNALELMRTHLEDARRGKVWNGQTIGEFKAERARMERRK